LNLPDKRAFLERTPPFDRLDASRLSEVADALSFRHFDAKQIILKRWDSPRYFFLIVDGQVEEHDTEGVVGHYSTGDAFDARALIEGRSQHSFVARNDCRCYLLPDRLFLNLTRNDPKLHDYYYEDLAHKLDALVAIQQQREAASFMMARIGDGDLHPALFVAPETSLHAAADLMRLNKVTALLVNHNRRTGIFTARDVREQGFLSGKPNTTPIGDLAHYGLITLDQDDFLFNALVVMIKHEIRHIVITRGDEILGILEQMDLLKYLSGHSYLIANQIERADALEDLRKAGDGIPHLIKSLHERGVKPRYIARVVTDLNRKIFRKLYQQMMPPAMIEDGCLIVMGSEGRGEQLLRTDQDNALILGDEAAVDTLHAITTRFTEALVTLGYPRCPGEIMVSNPFWAKPLAAYKESLFQWIHHPDEQARMNLAIFYDASPSAGNQALLENLKAYLFHLLRASEVALQHFAKATQAFDTPLGLFNRFALEKGPHQGQLDIKKGGIFPIVHGVRSLALQQRLSETNTIARIQALSGVGLFDDRFTADLIESLEFMSMLRLRAQLEVREQGGDSDNYVAPAHLNKLEQDLLKESLKIVKEFKTFIHYHFKLSMVS
jgi:CBS domain-containing protein